jgi:hypothetical protein
MNKFLDFINKINKIDLDDYKNQQNFIDYKFNLDNKLKDEDICYKNLSYNIAYIYLNNNKINFKIDIEVLKNQITKSRYNYILIIFHDKDNNFHHISSLIIDNKLKKNILFDNKGDKNLINLVNLIIKKLELKYPLTYSYKYSKNLYKCDICGPFTFLFIYSYIKFNIDLNKFIKFFNDKTTEDSFNIVNKFIKFLKSN